MPCSGIPTVSKVGPLVNYRPFSDCKMSALFLYFTFLVHMCSQPKEFLGYRHIALQCISMVVAKGLYEPTIRACSAEAEEHDHLLVFLRLFPRIRKAKEKHYNQERLKNR